MGRSRISLGAPVDLRQQVMDVKDVVAEQPSISLATRNKLFRKLDATRNMMERLKNNSSSISEFTQYQLAVDLENLPEEITELYGRIHTLSVEHEVKEVEKEAQHLEMRLENGDAKAVAKEVSRLKKHISHINDHHRLAGPTRTTMTIAKQVASRADKFLLAHSLNQAIPPRMTYQLNVLEALEYQSELDGDLIIELFEVAEDVFFGLEKQAMKRYNQLPEYAKRRCKAHFATLGISTPLENRTKTAQALIATAYDLSDGEDTEPYFSEETLTKLFQEAKKSS